jgi:hypothetical protein
MGQAKNREIKAWDNWTAEARSKGHRCSQCGCTPEHDERDTFFAVGMCGFCARATGALDAYYRSRGLST